MSSSEQPVFYLGLCMAGAISAGAYTAGVLDYLIETLDRWEQARRSGDPRVPQHRVMIDLMTGASAGGMTAAISLAALFDRIDYVNPQHGGYRQFRGHNKLYEAWVRMTADEMLPELLKTDDIPKHGAASVLNSDFVDRIAQKMLRLDKPTTRAFVSPDLEVALSLTSLTGIPAVIEFGNDQPGSGSHRRREVDGRYITYNHRDFGHFILSDQYQNDGRIPFSFLKPDDEGLRILRDCAMATGAFPLGLRWRAVHRLGKYLNQSHLINPNVDRPLFGIDNDKEFATVNVDGGILNNEPFEVAEKLFTQYRKRKLERGQNTQASILMIDPFPSIEDQEQIQPRGKIRLKTLIGEIYSTARTQLLFKPGDLEDATDPTIFGRFLMAPSRNIRGRGKVVGTRAIACGSLEGFGGFLTRDFRMHDFQLGRRNCQQFLRMHFAMPVDTTNPILTAGYADARAREALVQELDVEDKGEGRRVKCVLPIIPDINLKNLNTPLSIKQESEEKPAYPVFNEVTMRDLVFKNEQAIEDRLMAVLDDNQVLGNLGVRLLALLFKNGAANAIYDLIIEDLKTHGLIKPNQTGRNQRKR